MTIITSNTLWHYDWLLDENGCLGNLTELELIAWAMGCQAAWTIIVSASYRNRCGDR